MEGVFCLPVVNGFVSAPRLMPARWEARRPCRPPRRAMNRADATVNQAVRVLAASSACCRPGKLTTGWTVLV